MSSFFVGATGFEPVTPTLSTQKSVIFAWVNMQIINLLCSVEVTRDNIVPNADFDTAG